MDKKVFSIILGLAFVVCFFLPTMVGPNGSGSMLDFVKYNAGSRLDFLDQLFKYIWILFPLSGLMLLLGALNNGKYPGGRSMWVWLPFLAILYVVIIYPLIKGVAIGDIFKSIGKGWGIGYWIALVASIIGIAYNPRS